MRTIILFSVLVLLALEVHSIPSYISNVRDDLSSIVQRVTNIGRHDGCSNGRVDHSVEVISWEPRAVIYHNFLSKEECEHVISISKPHMKKSTMMDLDHKGEIEDTFFRTSYITLLARGQDETVRAIEKRISDLAFLPIENGQGFQVLHYEVGQKFRSHSDYDISEHRTKDGGRTIATFILYLSDVEEGGETVFPYARGNISTLACWGGKYDDRTLGLSVKPKMGDALLFWNIKPDGIEDPTSFHGGCPVIKGSKWSATKWIHVNKHRI